MNPFHLKLNSPEYLPEIAYRRNHMGYKLVCYVNNLIGAQISGNRDGIEIFKRRVLEYLEEHPALTSFEQYCALVREYLQSVDVEAP